MADLLATLTASVVFRIDSEAFKPRPPLNGVKLALFFRRERTEADARSIKPILVPGIEVDIPRFGKFEITVTISWDGLGLGDFQQADGSLVIPIRLRFANSLGRKASLLTLDLTTGKLAGELIAPLEGKAVDRGTQKAKLVGKGKFVDGELDGVGCEIAIDGVFDRSPFN